MRLPLQHFAAASLYLLAGAVGLVWIAPELAAGNFLSPHVAGVTHLFTLGFLTTTIFGALYQLLPVALGAPLRWPRIGDLSFWTFAPGAGLFACGVADSSTLLHHGGLGLVAVGIVLAIVNIGATLPKSRTRDVTWAAMASSLTFLASTLVLGIVLLHNIHTGFLAELRVRILATHLHVAIVGWALVMMVGVSHRLLPMFLLAHGAKTMWTKRALTLLALGVPVLGTGLSLGIVGITWLGALLLDSGVTCFVMQAYSFYRVRVRKKLDVGLLFSTAALGFLCIASVLGLFVLARGIGALQLATAYVLTGLLGGVVLYVIGLLYKIVPLLVWTVRYRGQSGTAGTPVASALYSTRAAGAQLGTYVTGIVVLLFAVPLGIPAGALAGTALLLVSVLIFSAQLLRISFIRADGARP